MTVQRSDAALILFTLSPDAEGRRKPLGLGLPENAAAVFSELLGYLEQLCDLPGVDLLLSSPERPERWGKHAYLPRKGRRFGESLRMAVEDAFALGYRRVVVIGNDAPEISRAYLRAAFRALEGETAKAALGPSTDGGYNLLGLSRPCPAAFEDMPWGSRRVGTETRARLAGEGFSVAVLDALPDIDGSRDLGRFLGRAARTAPGSRLHRLARVVLRCLAPRRTRGPEPATASLAFSPAQWPLLRAPPARLALR